MSQHYSNPARMSDPHALPDIEVFYVPAWDMGPLPMDWPLDVVGNPLQQGWYWWACFPGCLPDGEATGPFASKAEAIEDATE